MPLYRSDTIRLTTAESVVPLLGRRSCTLLVGCTDGHAVTCELELNRLPMSALNSCELNSRSLSCADSHGGNDAFGISVDSTVMR